MFVVERNAGSVIRYIQDSPRSCLFVVKRNGSPFIRDLQHGPRSPPFVCKLNVGIIVVGNSKSSTDLPIAPENYHTLEVANVCGRKSNSSPVLTIVEFQCRSRSQPIQDAEFLALRSEQNELLGLHRPFRRGLSDQ